VAFHAVVFSILALDLGLFNRKSHVTTVKQALGWTAFWVALSLAFCGGLFVFYDRQKALEFFTGYVIEYALSVDNIFVFILVFTYFQVPAQYQHRVLFWGVIGAFLMRGTMIGVGTALIHKFSFILYGFGAFLIYSGLKLAFGKDNEVDPSHNPAVNLLRKFMPVSRHYHGSHFITHENGKRMATPLLAVLLVVETTDLIFAVDSIPAIFGVVKSADAFIIYTSNVCAILGLRSLYFALAGVMDLFHFLKYGLAFVLSFVGAKMLLEGVHLEIPITASLGIVVGALFLAVLASVALPRHPEERPAHLAADCGPVSTDVDAEDLGEVELQS
jgi:tellurite resistance protein TerC